nr:hypothetical transcript [Hymenolepis microstoma]
MEMVGLRELTGKSADMNDEVTGFSNILQSFPTENKPDAALNGSSTLSHTSDASGIHAQASDILSKSRSTRSFLVAQYPTDSVINPSISFENLDTYQEPEIIDITNQTPRKPGNLLGTLMKSMTTDEDTHKRPSSLRDRRAKFTQPSSPSSLKVKPDSGREEPDESSSVVDSSVDGKSTVDQIQM